MMLLFRSLLVACLLVPASSLLLFSPASFAQTCSCKSSCECGCQEGKPCKNTCITDKAKQASFTWLTDGGEGYGLMQGDNQVGWLSGTGRFYWRYAAGKFGEECEPPIPRPRMAGNNFGVETDKIGRTPSYHRNGKSVSRGDIVQALEKGLVDDSALPRLTVIGPEEARKRVLTDLNSSPALAPWKGKFLVQDYTPDNWAIQGLGFVTTGSPTIYAQRPDGVVLHRQDGYEGPEKLAQALRKADPTYDPKKDPDLAKPGVLGIDWKNLPWPGIVIGVLAAYLLLRKGDSQ